MIDGIMSFKSSSSLSLELWAFDFSWAHYGNPNPPLPIMSLPLVGPLIFACTANDASTYQFSIPVPCTILTLQLQSQDSLETQVCRIDSCQQALIIGACRVSVQRHFSQIKFRIKFWEHYESGVLIRYKVWQKHYKQRYWDWIPRTENRKNITLSL